MKSTVLVFLTFISLLSKAQQETILESYVRKGLENNLALKQNSLSLQKAEHTLKIARGMFLPSVSMQARYLLAQGGRTIDFPVGDLMNPVYTTLNSMIEAQGQNGPFSNIANEEIAFMRGQEYDAKLSVTQPLYSRSLYLNKKISQQQLSMTKYELDKFKRELTFQIKEAYYNYIQTIQLTEMVKRTKEVVDENYRVTNKLFNSNLVAKDAVLRAKSEVSRVLLFETTVAKNKEMAQYYFNFLINNELNTEIKIESSSIYSVNGSIDTFTKTAIEKREELSLLNSQTVIYELLAQINSAENLPLLLAVLDAGMQGEKFSNVSDGNYLMGSLVLNWNLFNGNINKNKRQQALIEYEKSEIQRQEVMQRIILEVKQDFLSIQELNQNHVVATDRKNEATEVYRIIEKRYSQGEAALIELLDARNNMVESESDLINIKYKLLTSIAKLEKSSSMAINQK